MMMDNGRCGWLVAALAAAGLATACNEPQSPAIQAALVGPGGAMTVAATTSGSDADADGYVARVDISTTQPVAPNGIVTFTGLADGEHRVDLYGTAGNCWSLGNDPRLVSVTGGLAGATRFDVGCVAGGSLYVSAHTTGVDLDANGYTVTVDGAANQALAANDSIWFNGVSSYDTHSIALSGVAANCTVSGVNPRTASVSSGGTTQVDFALSCTPLSGGTGTLRVTTATTGSNLDPDGYTMTIDGTSSRAVGINTAISVSAAAGNHPVMLSGVAPNCTVGGANPRTVSVPAGGLGTTTFSVSCSAALPPTEMRGGGQLKFGSPINGTYVQTFAFDVRADGTGRFTFTDWSDIHPSGQAGTITTDPAADPATYFTAIRTRSSACADPSRGLEFDAVGREDEGILRSYTVELCDNGAPGTGGDFFSIYARDEGYGRSGTVTAGDIARR